MELKDLSPEDKRQLMEQLKEDEKTAKVNRKKNVKAYKDLSGEFVLRNIDGLVNHHMNTGCTIEKLFEDYQSILDIKQEIYGVKDQDSHTSTVADGSSSITIGHNVSINFDGTESAGVEKIKNFIATLSGESDKVQKLIDIVNTFLKPNAKTGMLNPVKIIELNSLREKFNNPEFDEGLDIIISSQIRCKNSMYVSGWKFIKQEDGQNKKLDFRFTV